MRLAHIENEQIISAIEPGFEFARRNLRHLYGWARSLFAAHAAEFVVIDELGDGGMRSTHRAIRILAEFEFAELHSESIKQQQSPDEIVSASENQFYRFHRLDGADN